MISRFVAIHASSLCNNKWYSPRHCGGIMILHGLLVIVVVLAYSKAKGHWEGEGGGRAGFAP